VIGEPTIEQIEKTISEDMLRIHDASFGGSAGSARTYIHDEVVLCLLDHLELMPNEEFLVGEGRQDAVLEMRKQFQDAMQLTFKAAVERATGRRVIAVANHTELDPRIAVEVFLLAPSSDAPEAC
jgi:uncharacterized protein YbcI